MKDRIDTKVSIIIPVYNVEAVLERTINSILQQEYRNFEVLLINDGSTDSSGKICDYFAAIDSRIRVFHKKNGGVSSARNVGLENAAGEYIVFIDSDDVVETNFLLLISEYFGDFDAIFWGMKKISSEGENLGGFLPLKMDSKTSSMADILYSLLKIGLLGFMCSMSIRKSLILDNDIKFIEGMHLHEDAIFCYDCLLHASSCCSLDIQPYNYYIYPLGLSSKTPSNYDDIALLRIEKIQLLFQRINMSIDKQNEILSNWKMSAYLRCLDEIFLSESDRITKIRSLLIKFKGISNFSVGKSFKAIPFKFLINSNQPRLILFAWKFFNLLKK